MPSWRMQCILQLHAGTVHSPLTNTLAIVQSRKFASSTEADAAKLNSLGYVQVLKRDMSYFSNFAISFSIISILTGVSGNAVCVLKITG